MTVKETCFANEMDAQNGVVTEFIVKEGYEKELQAKTNAHFAEDFLYTEAKKDDAIVWENRVQ